jgi:hypothetical protein
MIANRTGDGAGAPDVYTPTDQAGEHRPDPFHPNQGYLGVHWGDVTLFGMTLGDIAPVAPPALGSTP